MTQRGFDPDAFLAQTAPRPTGGFDPDAYLAQTAPAPAAPAPPPESGFVAGLKREAGNLGTAFVDNAQDALKTGAAAVMGVSNAVAPHLGAALSTGIGQLTGDERNAGDEYNDDVKRYKATLEDYRKYAPKAFALGDLVPSLAIGAEKKLGMAALSGAEAGLKSDAPDLKGRVWDATKGFGLGLGVGSVAEYGPKAASALSKTRLGQGAAEGFSKISDYISSSAPVKAVSKVAANAFGDLPGTYVERLLKNPDAPSAKSFEKIGEEVADTANKLHARIKSGEELAASHLSSDPKFVKDELAADIKELLSSRGISEKSGLAQNKTAYRKANEVMDELANKGDALSEVDIRKFRQDIDDEIDWKTPGNDTANAVLKEIRAKFDARLKKANPNYEQAVEPLARDIKDLEKLEDGFKLDKARARDAEAPYSASDTSLTKLKGISDDLGKPEQLKVKATKSLEDLHPGAREDLVANRDYRTMVTDKTRGSKKTLAMGTAGATVGTMIGGPIGGLIGGSIGGAGGHILDKYNSVIVDKGLRMSAPAIKMADTAFQSAFKTIPSLANGFAKLDPKYQALLINTAARGASSLAVTHHLLMNSDPEYKAQMEGPSS